jgi:hypothetical protein
LLISLIIPYASGTELRIYIISIDHDEIIESDRLTPSSVELDAEYTISFLLKSSLLTSVNYSYDFVEKISIISVTGDDNYSMHEDNIFTHIKGTIVPDQEITFHNKINSCLIDILLPSGMSFQRNNNVSSEVIITVEVLYEGNQTCGGILPTTTNNNFWYNFTKAVPFTNFMISLIFIIILSGLIGILYKKRYKYNM